MASFMTVLSRFCYRSPSRPFFVAGLIFLILITWKFLVAQPDANALMMNTKHNSWKYFAGKNSRPEQIHAPLQSPVKKDEGRKRIVNKIHESKDIIEPEDKEQDASFKTGKEIEGETQDGGKVEPAQDSKQMHLEEHVDFEKKEKSQNSGLVIEQIATTKGKNNNIYTSPETSKEKESEKAITEEAHELKTLKTKMKTDGENDTKKMKKSEKPHGKANKSYVLNTSKQAITPTYINHVGKSSEEIKAGNSLSNGAEIVVQSQIPPPTLKTVDTPNYPTSEYNVLLTLVKMTPNSPLARNFKKFLKSVCRHSSITFTLHVVVDDSGRVVVEDFFKTGATGLCAETQVVYHNVQSVVGQLKSLTKLLQAFFSSNQNSYYNDPIFFMSTALHRVFPDSIKRIIMMDVDLRFVSDIRPLFEMFDNFKRTNIMGIAQEQSPVYRHVLYQYRAAHPNTLIGNPPPKGNPGYNSGVVLFHLENMRNSGIYNRILAGDEIKSLSDKYNFRGHLGDQDFFTLLSVEFPELFYTIPCSWNRQLCTYWKENGYEDVFDQYANCSGPIHVYHGNCRTEIPVNDKR